MALSEFYESTIIETKATFGFSNFECDPDVITQTMGITSDISMRKGEEHVLQTGENFLRPFNSWGIISRSTSKDVNVHLRELLDRLGQRYELVKSEWGRPEFGITWKNNYLYTGTGPFFESDVLQGIATWRAMLFQDIYQIDQEQEDAPGTEQLRRLSREELRILLRNNPDDIDTNPR